MALTQTGTEPELLKEFWLDVFLNEYRANLVFADLASKSTVPRGEGLLVHWLSLADLSAASTISEGFDPTAYALSAGDLTANLTQYGKLVPCLNLL